MNLLISILISICIAHTLARVLFLVCRFLVKRIIKSRLNKGSSNYLDMKSKLESCIQSGEINSYFDGFQFIKVDKSQDSTDMADLQSNTVPLNKIERYKLIEFGKSLIDKS